MFPVTKLLSWLVSGTALAPPAGALAGALCLAAAAGDDAGFRCIRSSSDRNATAAVMDMPATMPGSMGGRMVGVLVGLLVPFLFPTCVSWT